MTVFIIGGTGRIGLKLAELLRPSGHSVLIASRSGKAPEPFPAVKFDWLDSSTFESPFTVDPKIDRVLLVLTRFNALEAVSAFIDLAVSKGVKRFVLVGASSVEKGGPFHGEVHEYLDKIGVEYTVLRPTWFIGEFDLGGLRNRLITSSQTILEELSTKASARRTRSFPSPRMVGYRLWGQEISLEQRMMLLSTRRARTRITTSSAQHYTHMMK